MAKLALTGSQTVGPFFAPCLLREDAVFQVLARPETSGEHIRIEGRVLDGDGEIVPDALVEIWQANAHGRYNHPADQGPNPLDPTFTGYGRSGINEDGYFWFETVKPGSVGFDSMRQQAPHLNVTVFARGLLNHVVTRLYFEDEAANEQDPVLLCVPEARRATIIARRVVGDSAGKPVYHLDIILQGEGETAFFNL